MKKILHIISSINGKNSFSTKLSESVLAKLNATYPNSIVKTIDLAQNVIPHIDGFQIGAFFTPESARTTEQMAAILSSDEAVKELLESDIIVIGVPLYNLSVPSSLKAWIDHIVRAGVTFQYVDGVPQGMVNGKKVFLAIASGSVFSEGPFQALDFSEPYLKTILGFIGLTDVTTFRVEGVAKAEYKEGAVAKAFAAVEAYDFA